MPKGMTDKQFQDLMDKTGKQGEAFFASLKKLETEFEARYGFNPSDRNMDAWIDSFHYNPGNRVTIKDVDQWVKDL